MTFVAPTWTNGDTITEVKMDQMVASDEHVREEASYWNVLNVSIRWQNSGADPFTMVASVDGSTSLGSHTVVGSSASEYEFADVNISARSTGLHELVIDFGGGGYVGERKFVFYKTPDMDYLSLFSHAVKDSETGDTDVVFNITVMGHRETKSWTW